MLFRRVKAGIRNWTDGAGKSERISDESRASPRPGMLDLRTVKCKYTITTFIITHYMDGRKDADYKYRIDSGLLNP